MSRHERLARIENIDLGTGIFAMTLVTEGEASDGHILSIKGGQIPERMPMLNSHWNSPTETLGSITDPVKHLKDSPPRLRAIGHIEMAGEGPAAEIRRDLAHMIDKGHVTGMSIRWDDVPGKAIRRVNLPSDHAYFVDENKAKGPERWGYFFEEWIAREGSVVALGADPQALIGRAEETEGDVSIFWRAMANESIGDERFADEPPDESPSAKIAASLAGLRIDAADCLKAGASHADCINAVTDTSDGQIEAVEIDDFVVFLSEPLANAVRSKITIADAAETIEEQESSLEELEHLQESLEALESRLEALEERAEPEVSPASPQEEREGDEPLPSIIEKDGREDRCEPPAQTALTPSQFIDAVIEQLRAAHAPPEQTGNPNVVRPSEMVRRLSNGLDEARKRVQEKRRAAMKEARGEI